MSADVGSDLPGQPPPYTVNDDVELLQTGDDDKVEPTASTKGGSGFQPGPALQQLPPPPYASTQPQILDIRQLQQQPSPPNAVVVVTREQTTVGVVLFPVESYYGYMALACLVTWLFNPIMGVIAFVFAARADRMKTQDPVIARQFGRSSLRVSISGIIASVVVGVIIVALLLAWKRSED